MFKKVKVVLLPTNNEVNGRNTDNISDIVLFGGNLFHMPTSRFPKKNGQNQNIYILSDDEIKEGDWCVSKNLNTLYQLYNISVGVNPNNFWYKVIATTNTSLGSYWKLNETIPLPQPSQSFIEKYIKEYNNNTLITDVLVEYEQYDYDEEWSETTGAYTTWKTKLKINPKDNTITIKKIKDSWSREEVELHCRIAFYAGMANTPMTGEKVLNEWIESNL